MHEFERNPVLAVFGVQASAQLAVEFGGVDVPEAAGLVDVPAALEGHLVHDAEHVSACCRREADVIRIELTQRVDGQLLVEQRRLEQVDDASDRTLVGHADVGNEDREERAGMDDQQALASVEPEQVRYQSSSLGGAPTSVTVRLM